MPRRLFRSDAPPGDRAKERRGAGRDERSRSAERLSQAVVDGLEEGVVVFDADLRPLEHNDSAVRILGLDRHVADPLGAFDFAAVLDEAGEPVARDELPHVKALATRESCQRTLRVRTPTGERWVRALAQPLELEDGVSGVVCLLHDTTASRQAERRLRAELERAEGYLEVASTLVVVLDFHGRIERINGQGCELLGFEEAELLGRDWFDVVIPVSERLQARQLFNRLVSEIDPPAETTETFVRTKDGDDRQIAWRNALVRDERGRVVSVLRSGEDVTERRRAEARVAYLAFHDTLTGLANRAQLERHLGREVARVKRSGGSLALLFFDLDNFKLVNDSLGHAAGDLVLREAAQRVSAFVRASDLLARQGGDEFLLLLACDDEDDPRIVARTAAERILHSLEAPLNVGGAQFSVGTSIGVAILGEDADDAEGLLRQADAAMYLAKRAGGSTVAFYEEPRDDARRRLSLSSRLRRAIDEDELCLHYQPIVPLDPTAPRGYEALVRWNDKEEGMIGPDLFIPIAEESGLIEELGRWVLTAVCRQAQEWARVGYHPFLSFNVSPRELRQPNLAATIASIIKAHGLQTSQFIAELTETAIMSGERRDTSLLHQLNEAGLSVAIDDFGSGYSSLGRLRDLPVQVLKIDRAFLRRVPQDRESAAIVSAVLSLASALGMTSVVEGVETEEQLAFLRENGATRVQGYLLGRPRPAVELGKAAVA